MARKIYILLCIFLILTTKVFAKKSFDLEYYETVDPYSIEKHSDLIEYYDELRSKYDIAYSEAYNNFEYIIELEEQLETATKELDEYKMNESQKEEARQDDRNFISHIIILIIIIVFTYPLFQIIKNSIDKKKEQKKSTTK